LSPSAISGTGAVAAAMTPTRSIICDALTSPMSGTPNPAPATPNPVR